MALDIDIVKRTVDGASRVVFADVTFDSSYPTDGEPLDADDLGFSSEIDFLDGAGGGIVVDYDYTNKKLKALVPGVATGAAGAGTLDDFPMSGVAATSASIGLTAGNTTTRFGLLKEVANGVDLSTVKVRVFARGV